MSTKLAIGVLLQAVDKVSGPLKGMKKNLASTQKDIMRINGQLRRVGASAGNIFSPLAGYLSVAAVTAFAEKSIQAYQDSAAALANVQAGLDSTKNKIGMTAEEFSKMASQAQKTTIFEDDGILQNVTAQLLTFGNIGKQNFERVQNASLDITAKLKGLNATSEDLRGTSIMLGKAMEDPVRGMNAMRRVGISFSQSEEKMIKAAMAHNDIMGAQRIMLQSIERQYGGTASKLAQTAGGMQKNVMNQIGDTMEEIGALIAPIKLDLMRALRDLLPYVSKLIEFFKEHKSARIMVGVVVALAAGLWSMNKALQVVDLLKETFTLIKMLGGVTKLWTAAQWALNIALNANPIGLVVIAIAALAGWTFLLWKKWDQMSTGMKVFAAVVSYLLFGPIGLLITAAVAIVKNWDKVKAFFIGMWDSVKGGFSTAINWIIQKFNALKAIVENFAAYIGQKISGAFNNLGPLGGLAKKVFGGGDAAGASGAAVKTGSELSQNYFSRSVERSEVAVNFRNMPRGTSVTQRGNARGVDLSMGYAGGSY